MTATLSLALACTDDAPASSGAGAGTDSETGTETESAGTDTAETETDGGSETGQETDTGDTGGETNTGDETDTDGPLVCEAEEPLGDWLFMLDGGIFPNDVPEDVDESCTVLAGPVDQLSLDCPFGDFALSLDLTPAPVLPDAGATAQVRVHHEPGWLQWPDLWIDVDVDGGDHFAFQGSSVVAPTVGSYVAPWDPTLTAAECGPFVLDGLGGADPCGEQVGQELEFAVDGESVVAWHGTHVATSIGGLAFEVWVSFAREYSSPPQFCDVSPTWYSVITRRERLL